MLLLLIKGNGGPALKISSVILGRVSSCEWQISSFELKKFEFWAENSSTSNFATPLNFLNLNFPTRNSTKRNPRKYTH